MLGAKWEIYLLHFTASQCRQRECNIIHTEYKVQSASWRDYLSESCMLVQNWFLSPSLNGSPVIAHYVVYSHFRKFLPISLHSITNKYTTICLYFRIFNKLSSWASLHKLLMPRFGQFIPFILNMSTLGQSETSVRDLSQSHIYIYCVRS